MVTTIKTTSARIDQRDIGSVLSAFEACVPLRADCAVRASANNQWRLDEEIAQERLEETSFYRAIKLSRGTVSVLDPKVRALSNSRHELMRVGVSAGRLL